MARKIPAKDLNMKCMRTLTMSFPVYRGLQGVYERHCNNFYPESVINILKIQVFKFVMLDYVISGVPRFAGSLQKN